ncbi:MAG: energy transducer TonB [Sphingomonas bacterium]|nr:energy transducer TonB [Sphingomonas bacterium]
MRMSGYAAIAALLLASGAAAKLAPPAKLLTPSGKWAVEYAKEMCVLNRKFGRGADEMLLAIKPAPNSDQARIIVLVKAAKSRVRTGTATVRFSDGSVPGYAMASSGWANGMVLTAIDLPRSSLAPLVAGGKIAIRFGPGLNHEFAPTAMAPAMQALAKCERDLLKGWGMSEAAQDAIATMPKVEYTKLFKSQDYLIRLIEKGIQGSVGALLSVDSTGAVSACRAIESSRTVELDELTCAIFLKRARYEPAIDKSGKAVSALTYYRVNWMIEDGSSANYRIGNDPPPVAPATQY